MKISSLTILAIGRLIRRPIEFPERSNRKLKPQLSYFRSVSVMSGLPTVCHDDIVLNNFNYTKKKVAIPELCCGRIKKYFGFRVQSREFKQARKMIGNGWGGRIRIGNGWGGRIRIGNGYKN